MTVIPDNWPEPEKETFRKVLREKGVGKLPENESFPELWEMVETHAPELVEEFQQDCKGV
jgi:hypothetical protein